jgi:intraflagellar transport protein 172
LRAERPELAVKLYKDNGMWPDALRVCKEYLPNKLDQLREEFDRNVSDKSNYGVEGLLEQATKWEATGEYTKSVDSFIKITVSSQIDKETAVRCWMKACDLSQKFLSEHKSQNVAQIVGRRLVDLNKPTMAAELYLKVDLIKDCIDAFICAEEWGKAKKVADQLDKRYPYLALFCLQLLFFASFFCDIKLTSNEAASQPLLIYMK